MAAEPAPNLSTTCGFSASLFAEPATSSGSPFWLSSTWRARAGPGQTPGQPGRRTASAPSKPWLLPQAGAWLLEAHRLPPSSSARPPTSAAPGNQRPCFSPKAASAKPTAATREAVSGVAAPRHQQALPPDSVAFPGVFPSPHPNAPSPCTAPAQTPREPAGHSGAPLCWYTGARRRAASQAEHREQCS